MGRQKLVRCSIATYATEIGRTPQPIPLSVDVGTENMVPSREARTVIEQAIREARSAAVKGRIAEVRLLFVPDDLGRGRQG